MASEDEPKRNNKKQIPADDLLNLNQSEGQQQITTIEQDPVDAEQAVQQFDISKFEGFPLDLWIKFQGSINDSRQRRRVSIANADKYKLRYNASDDNDLPEWQILELEYHPITVQAWQKRQNDLAVLEDKTREIGAIDLQLSEIQSNIRARTSAQFKNPASVSLEELQKNVTYIQNLSRSMKQDFQNRKNEADKYAFKIYFHKDQNLYDKVRADDIEDIIGACDWKQTNGPANLNLSRNSLTRDQPGVI